MNLWDDTFKIEITFKGRNNQTKRGLFHIKDR